MKTTNMYVEQVIIGLMVLLAIWLFVMGIHFPDELYFVNWPHGDLLGIVDATFVLVSAYLLGMVYDRVADTILTPTDRHNRLRFALKGKAKASQGSNRNIAIESITEDPFPENKLRIKLLDNGEATEHAGYLRSRMRLMRSLCTLIPLYTVIATLWLVSDADAPAITYNRWTYSAGLLLLLYGLPVLLAEVWQPKLFTPPPKTSDINDLEEYLRTHIAQRTSTDYFRNKKIPTYSMVWRWSDCLKDPAWLFLFATSAICFCLLLQQQGAILCYWYVPVTGFLLTLLAGWVWLRISKTFMKFLRDYAQPRTDVK